MRLSPAHQVAIISICVFAKIINLRKKSYMYCSLSATVMKTGVFVPFAVNIDGEGKEKGPKRDRGRSGFVEGFDYFGNERVADYVFVGESDGGDAFNAFEETDAGKEAAV